MDDAPLPRRYHALLEACRAGEVPMDRISQLFEQHIHHDPRSLEVLFRRIEALLLERGLDHQRAWILHYRAWVEETLSRYKEALALAEVALALFTEHKDSTGQFRASNLLMACYSDLGDLDTAVHWSVKAEELAETNGDPSMIKSALNNIAHIHLRLSDWSDALETISKARAYPSDKDQLNLAVEINHAAALAGLGQHAEAKAEIQQVVILCHARGYLNMEAECLIITGSIAASRNEHQEALHDYQSGMRLAKRFGDHLLLANAARGAAGSLLALGFTRKAALLCAKALDIAERINDKVLTAACNKDLSQIHAERRPRKALEHYQAYHRLDHEIFTRRSTTALEEERRKRAELETKAVQTMYDQISAISAIGQEITASLSLEAVLETVHSRILSLMPAESFGIAIHKPDENILDYALFIDDGKRLPELKVPVDADNSIGAWCFRNQQPFFSNNLNEDWSRILGSSPRTMKGGELTRRKSALFVPLVAHGSVLGIMSVQSNSHGAYTLLHLDSLRALATFVSIAIENARLFQDVNHRATFDLLTGVYNRPSILEKATEHFTRVRRNGGNLSLLMVDVDHFKDVNDHCGHQTGDTALQSVARIIGQQVREVDLVGRYGGEEFMVVLADTALEGAKVLAERIRKAVESTVLATGNKGEVRCTLSVGGRVLQPEDRDLDSLVRQADEALYWCKDHGRNLSHIV